MVVLRNARHEKFAQELARGCSSDEAYRLAGYKPDRGHASRLAANGNVSRRAEQLRARGAMMAEITLESLLREAEEARVAAMEACQFSAAISAIKEKGVLSGLRVEKSERKNLNDVRSLTDEELDAAIAGALAREAAAEPGSAKPH